METIRTAALVLKTSDFSETSQIVSFLTPGQGRLTALARGSRRPRYSGGGPWIAPALAEIVVQRRETRELDLLAEGRIRDDFPGLRRRLEKINAAWYILELVLRGVQQRQAVESLFAETCAVLQRIERLPDFAAACLAFEGRYLEELGFAPEIAACVGCRAPLRRPGGPVGYDAGRGGVLCARCAGPGSARLSPRALAALGLLAATRRPEGLRLEATTREEIGRFLRGFIGQALERRPVMWAYLGREGAAPGNRTAAAGGGER